MTLLPLKVRGFPTVSRMCCSAGIQKMSIEIEAYFESGIEERRVVLRNIFCFESGIKERRVVLRNILNVTRPKVHPTRQTLNKIPSRHDCS